jgi:predicted DNA-binding transcriptional regulator AlpA
MALNFWFEHIIDAYLRACAEGRPWREACATAEANTNSDEVRILTQKDLKAKGIPYSRQHIGRKVNDGTFPRPFQTPTKLPVDPHTRAA